MRPMTLAKAADFWRGVAASLARGERALRGRRGRTRRHHRHGAGRLGAAGEPAASRRHRQDAGAPARAPAGRGRGGARGRRSAPPRDAGRTLLVLDTASAEAERLYERGGWQRVGTIPELRADARRRALRHSVLLQKAGLTPLARLQQARAPSRRARHETPRIPSRLGGGVRVRLPARVHARGLRGAATLDDLDRSATSRSSSSPARMSWCRA